MQLDIDVNTWGCKIPWAQLMCYQKNQFLLLSIHKTHQVPRSMPQGKEDWAFAHDCSRLYIYSHARMIILLLNLWQKILCSSTLPIKWDFIGANCLSCDDVESMYVQTLQLLRASFTSSNVLSEVFVKMLQYMYVTSSHLLLLITCLSFWTVSWNSWLINTKNNISTCLIQFERD